MKQVLEPVRLVIWDLDQTFWAGTLTEGDQVYSRPNHEIVVALAKRGIISSVCSKNDRDAVESILRREGIWQYFVFPSIDWTPKGSRVAAIIETAQLRPSTVLFIDDTPLNLAEAQSLSEGLQVAGTDMIPHLLTHPLLVGKADEDLSRLAQYKVLETKQVDRATVAGDNAEFLRQSEIRVFIDYDVENHLERAVELVNRTNQLNFVKVRLPEDRESAKSELLQRLRANDINSGMVFASDRYGTYGAVGFYLLEHGPGFGRWLHQYCFSCRTLGMGIESWLYERIGRPHISVQGPVLTDLHDVKVKVDWITEVSHPAALAHGMPTIKRLQNLVVHGGCDVRAIEHYLEGFFQVTHEEMNDVVESLEVRTDHSILLRHALDGVAPEAVRALEPLCFRPKHFTSAITDLQEGGTNVVLLSLWSDGRIPLYRDRHTGIAVPIHLPGQRYHDLFEVDAQTFESDLENDVARRAGRYLRERFTFEGQIALDDYRVTVARVLSRIPDDTLVMLIQSPEFWYRDGSDETVSLVRESALNAVNAEVASGRKNVILLEPANYAVDRDEYMDFLHYRRSYYQRLAMGIRDHIERFFNLSL